ncbi:SusC/RagA family TonB-linked outer membrane protein [Lutibacter sp. A64]|uniref:SusC/RagA family TonB-linked outer membrane protein n=1 Tax=Lutibacter sp. A64 TaxID=2918526 RepID=UPI001F062F63|nr:SusC/RagA family TonB-linked outer membrane protein [Lutibacter sp. A64]UMB55447.1 SusC/RagA family TonB-linked outer membrane protein [Lutibacter sp. A64]
MEKLFSCKNKVPTLFKKTTRVNLLLFYFLTFSIASIAATENLQSKPVDFKLENVTIEKLIDEIELKTDYRFVYIIDDVDLTRVVSVEILKGDLKTALNKVFKATNTTFNIMDKQIILKKRTENTLKEQQITIKGAITTQMGEPFPGVNVFVKRTNIGTTSDFDGNYALIAMANDTLTFRYLGYKTKYIPVNSRTIINVQMEEDVAELSEVVINGVFERKADSYTGSTTTITSKELRNAGSQNIFQAIQNIDPSIGLLDNFDLGSNPNTLPDLQIRGTSTFPQSEDTGTFKGNYLKNPNQPLFILNGFEVSIERVFDLDFNRIERLTILKDAASKALYGSKAANGVVVIETKNFTGEDALVTYTTRLDLELPDLSSYNLTNSLQKLEAERIDGLYTPSLNDADSYVELMQLYNYRLKLAKEGLDTDWLSKPLQNGVGHRHSLSVELGSDDLKILANINYKKTNGAMKGSSRENFGGDFTSYYRVKNLKFRNITSIISSTSVESPYGEFSEYAIMNPYWRAKNIDGSIPYYAELGTNGQRYTNPLYNSTLDSKNESGYFNFINNLYLEWQINPTLKAVSRIGIDIKKSNADEFYPSNHTMFDSYSATDKDRKGSYQVNNGESSYLSADLNLQYSKSINKNFFFGNAGLTISESKYEEVSHLAEGFPSSRLDDIIFARDYALDSRPTGISGLSRDIGFLAVGSYSYDNRFLSDATFRTSASSQFGEDKQWSNFWSLGLGWNVHNEKFLNNSSFVEQFKLRASVGSTGNQNFNENQSIITYGYYLDSQYQGFSGSYVQNAGNPGLQWETKLDYNAGFDAKFKNLSLRFDYYESYTENLITDITIPYSTGFNSVKDNLGRVKNNGIELNTSYLLWNRGKDFFSVNFGITTNNNKIVELSDAMQSFNEAQEAIAADRGNNTPVLKYEDGMSMNAIWAVESLGIDPATGNEIYLKQDGSTTYEWSTEDLVVAGNSSSKYNGVFGFSGEYKGFGLSVTARFLGGGQLYNQTLVDKVENVDMLYNVDERVLTGRWRYPGQEALFKRLGTYNVDPDGDNVYVSLNEKTRATSRFVQDRDELDIAAISFYYDFNEKVLDALGFERLRFMFNMNEVHKFSSIKIERGTLYPYARSMSFSLTANF